MRFPSIHTAEDYARDHGMIVVERISGWGGKTRINVINPTSIYDRQGVLVMRHGVKTLCANPTDAQKAVAKAKRDADAEAVRQERVRNQIAWESDQERIVNVGATVRVLDCKPFIDGLEADADEVTGQNLHYKAQRRRGHDRGL